MSCILIYPMATTRVSIHSGYFLRTSGKKWVIINETYLTGKRLMKAAFSLANRIALLPNYAVKR
ncbi:MAG: hypothetical protein ACI9O3_000072 [Colwellia sp.]|jgi:hypothetical protein